MPDVPAELHQPPELVDQTALGNLPAHPRLLLNKAGWDDLRQRVATDPDTAKLAARVGNYADLFVAAPAVDFTTLPGHNILAQLRQAERRILCLAMQWRLTEKPVYLAAAKAVLRDLLALAWPRGHFLDPATACFTVALAYDWLHGDLTAEERNACVEKIHREALISSTIDETQLGFLWCDFNWNQIINSCLAIGALAIAERDPALCGRLINRALALIPRAVAVYGPDGVYPEGPGYWSYGTTYEVLFIEACRSAVGTSHGLERLPGFCESATVLGLMTGPCGRSFNFADNKPERRFSSAIGWFVRETGNPALAKAEANYLMPSTTLAGDDADQAYQLPLALLWQQPHAAAVPTKPTGPLAWQGAGGPQPVAILRTSWADPQATWVAIKGGCADHSHAHMDIGSFVLEAQGVRWAIDPTYDPYLELRQRTGMSHGELFSYAQNSRRWGVFRLGPEGHNILRCDGARQDITGHVTLERIVTTAEGASVGVDLTPVYRNRLAQIRRQVTLTHDGRVIFDESWIAGTKNTEVTWQWLTAAEVTRIPGGVRLIQHGKSLDLQVADEVAVECQVVAQLLDPGVDGPDPGWTRIVLRRSTPANGRDGLRVTAIPSSVAFA